MIKNILHTLGSRFLVSAFNLFLLLITTNWMGAENKGAISLLVLNLSLASIFSGLFGGPSLVYLIPRFPLRILMVLNYTWSFITAAIITAIVALDWLPSQASTSSFFIMALLECLIAAHLMILLGKEKIKRHNLLQVLKAFIVVALLVFSQWKAELLDYKAFEQAYLSALLVTFGVSAVVLWIETRGTKSTDRSALETIQASLKYGFLVQVGNIAQLLNYRISFYFLELFIHPPNLALIRIGIYSASLQVAEALWQFARSISTVQYATVSNLKEEGATKGLAISLSLGKLNYMVTALGMLVLLLVPQSLYGAILGSEFAEIKELLYVLSLGIIALSLSNAFSHYFSGVGEHRFNTYSSLFGLIITVALGYPLTLHYGTFGAALTATSAYVLQTVYQGVVLKRRNKLPWSSFLVNGSDWKQLTSLLSFRKGS